MTGRSKAPFSVLKDVRCAPSLQARAYAALRFGTKDGTIPTIVGSLGKTVSCKKDREVFKKSLLWEEE